MSKSDQRDDALAFLSGGGEMSDLMRAFDWASTGLGPIADWPVEIKSAVALMLQSPLPMVALFGEVGTMIYNTAYSEFAGARHPKLLGSEVRKGWPEVADFNDHVIKAVFRAGQTLSFKDQELTLNRGAGPKQAWLDLDYSPVIGIDGTRLGVIAMVVETTDRVMADLKLQNERKRLRQMFEQSPSLMALLEGPEHRFVLANGAYLRLVRHRDVLGKTVAEASPQGVGQDHIALLDRVYTSGEVHRASLVPQDMQAVPGGPVERRFVDFVYQPISDANGDISGIFVDGVDVTDRISAQAAIRASEARFRTFAQVLPNHVWTAQSNGMLDWLNDRVSEYSGKPLADLSGAGWAAIVHPDDRPGAAERWFAAVAKGEFYETEFRIQDAAGDYQWHLVRANPIRDSDGTILQWIGTNTNIHAQKLAEAETTRDRDRLWAMSQDLMLVCDYRSVITAVNPSSKRMLGWSECEMVGKPVTDFVHPDDADEAIAEIERLAGGAKTRKFENRLICKDGSYRTLDWTAVPDDGRIHGVGRDITEYRRLARDRERIWNISPVVKVVMKSDGVISDANPSWTKVLGWSLDDTIGRSILDFLHPEDRERAAVNLGSLQAKAGMLSTESRYMTKSGGTRRIAWSIVSDNGTIYGFGRDITAETEAAEALKASQNALRQSQKMEAIGQLTGGVAHDFNNLLQVISGNLQLLSKDVAGNEKIERRIRSAMEAVSSGARLASQLLAFGRRQPLAPKVVNLGRLVRNMDEILRRALGDGVAIETIVADGLWNTLVDPGNVENALLNMAINGRDAMEGQGRLTIEVANAVLDDAYGKMFDDVIAGQYVMLSVTDTGTGIAPDLLEKVFEPFFTTKPEGRGTGLGLSMVYGFVKQSGGHVKIYSEPGQGTTIRLYLPRSSMTEDNLVVPDAGPIIGGAETILVVEDDLRVRDNVIEILTDLGYQVLQATDAENALAIIESGIPIDLMLTDVVMTGPLNSTDLARMAVERLPNLKVLFTSGYTENSIVHDGRLDPGVELLSKPYTREVLARKLRLQLAEGGHKAAPPSETPPENPQHKDGRLTVVLCEDDVLIRMATVGMLEDMGHSVIAAENAEAALRALAAEKVDILMTDIGLPDIPGTRLVEQARALYPDLAVIFATGHPEVDGFPNDRQTAVVVKPYDTATVIAAIEIVRPE